MSRCIKLLIGLLAALAATWLDYGPLGRGEAYVANLQERAGAVVREAAIPGVAVRIGRDPLRRVAILSGPANDFQREGIGQLPGLDERVGAVAGISSVRWDEDGGGIPLIAEMLALAAVAFLIGIGIGWLYFRPRKEGFL